MADDQPGSERPRLRLVPGLPADEGDEAPGDTSADLQAAMPAQLPEMQAAFAGQLDEMRQAFRASW